VDVAKASVDASPEEIVSAIRSKYPVPISYRLSRFTRAP
jgi:hypothetical protein